MQYVYRLTSAYPYRRFVSGDLFADESRARAIAVAAARHYHGARPGFEYRWHERGGPIRAFDLLFTQIIDGSPFEWKFATIEHLPVR